GASQKRINGDLYVTGRARYTGDVNPPGVLHLAVLRSPYAHARIRSIDTSAAKAAPGVTLALTGAEASKRSNPIPHAIDPALYGGKHADVRCLAVDKVGYFGEPVAAVLARSKRDARAALKLIEVDYDPLPVILDGENA